MKSSRSRKMAGRLNKHWLLHTHVAQGTLCNPDITSCFSTQSSGRDILTIWTRLLCRRSGTSWLSLLNEWQLKKISQHLLQRRIWLACELKCAKVLYQSKLKFSVSLGYLIRLKNISASSAGLPYNQNGGLISVFCKLSSLTALLLARGACYSAFISSGPRIGRLQTKV